MTFLNPDSYPEFCILQDHLAEIQSELKFVQEWFGWGSDAYDAQGDCLFLTGDWTVSLCYLGNWSLDDVVDIDDETLKNQVQQFCNTLPRMFPRITCLMNCIPSVNYAAFSKLAPHSRLASHRHSSPTSLIMHMGLQVPDGCGISVDVDEHDWQQPGDMIIFDDNQEHSAWNDSDEDRILLYVDFERGIDD